MELDVDALKKALQPDFPELRQAIKTAIQDPLFFPRHDISEEGDHILTRQQLIRLASLNLLQESDYTSDPSKIFAIHEALIPASTVLSAYTIQYNIFIGSLISLSTERHRRFVPDALSLKIIGCFALTEIGYGSNSLNIETTATYDPQTQTFDLHTPNMNSCKFWVSGYKPTYGVIFARLINAEGNQGVHPFFTSLRDQDNNLLSGIQELSLGKVIGSNGTGALLLKFTHFKMPFDSLMNRFADISPEGTYTSKILKKRDRFLKSIDRLIVGRICMSVGTVEASKLISLIVYRYASQRLAVGPTGKSDTPIMSYQLLQNAIVPYISHVIALSFAMQYAKRLFIQNDSFLTTVICTLKPITGWTANKFARTARERMGGAGYLSANLMAGFVAGTDSVLTVEGDNSVLMLKAVTDLLKKAAKGKYAPPTLTLCPVRQLPNVVDFDSLELLLELLRVREFYCFKGLSERIQRGVSAGSSIFEITNLQESAEIQRLGRAFGERIVAEQLLEAISRNSSLTEILSLVGHLYMLDVVKADLGWFMVNKFVSAVSAKNILARWSAAIKQLAPLLGKIIEAFDFPDSIIHSPAAGDYIGYNDRFMNGEVVLPKL